MRNIFLAVCLLVFVSFSFVSQVQALPIVPATPATCDEVQAGANTRYICTIPTVAASTTIIFKIRSLKFSGKIDEWHFETSSTDCDVWLSGLNEQASTAAPIIYYEGVNLSISVEIKDRDYVNMDTPQAKYLYWTVKNDDAINATGTSTLIIDYVRN